jgi:hypothetical protein
MFFLPVQPEIRFEWSLIVPEIGIQLLYTRLRKKQAPAASVQIAELLLYRLDWHRGYGISRKSKNGGFVPAFRLHYDSHHLLVLFQGLDP